jgi:hypothetical protein
MRGEPSKNPQIRSTLPIQNIKYGSANILTQTCSFRQILLGLIVFVSFHIFNRQS